MPGIESADAKRSNREKPGCRSRAALRVVLEFLERRIEIRGNPELSLRGPGLAGLGSRARRGQPGHRLVVLCDDHFLAQHRFLDQFRQMGLGLVNVVMPHDCFR